MQRPWSTDGRSPSETSARPRVARCRDSPRHEVHVKAVIAYVPAHQLLALHCHDGVEAFEQDAVRFGRYQRGRATVAPQAERDQLLKFGGFPEMQGAQFDVDDQHAGFRVGAHDVA